MGNREAGIVAIQFGELLSNSTKGLLHGARLDGLAVFGNVPASIAEAEDNEEVKRIAGVGGEVRVLAVGRAEGNPNVVPSVASPGLGLRNDPFTVELHSKAEISVESILGSKGESFHGFVCG